MQQRIIVFIEAKGSLVMGLMAQEALKRAAAGRGIELFAEVQEDGVASSPIAADVKDTDLVLSINDAALGEKYKGKQVHVASLDSAIKDATSVIDNLCQAVAKSAPAKQTAPMGNVGNGKTLNVVAVTACPTGIAHTYMAAEGLIEAAKSISINLRVETQGSVGVGTPLTDDEIAKADLVIISADREVDSSRFAGKPMYKTGTKPAIDNGLALIKTAIDEVKTMSGGAKDNQPTATASGSVKNIVAVTSCPTGIAHTYMAAEGLLESAKAMGLNMRVETQGSVGVETPLTDEEIANADLVIIAADKEVEPSRFVGKRLYKTGTKGAISKGQELINTAIASATVMQGTAGSGQPSSAKNEKTGPYKHLMTGISFMLPFIIAGGLILAISFAFDFGLKDVEGYQLLKDFGGYLGKIGGASFTLIVPALAGYIAFSIADRPGLTPGMVGGVIAVSVKAGFLGGILAGFVAGYITLYLNKKLPLPKVLISLKPILLLPLLGTLITGLIMYYIIGDPIAWVMAKLEVWLVSVQENPANAILVGLLLGGMMSVDLGGPINKVAYSIGSALLGQALADPGLSPEKVAAMTAPMGAVMLGGMVPPLACALACKLFGSKFTSDERKSAAPTAILGLCFISEAAIPFAARDPLRMLPSFIVGSAICGALSMLFAVSMMAPHGGIVIFAIGAVSNVPGALIALAVGTVVSAILIGIVKKRVDVPAVA